MAITKSRVDAVVQHVPVATQMRTIKNVQRGIHNLSGSTGFAPISAVNMSRSVVNITVSNTAANREHNWGGSSNNSGVATGVFDVSAYLSSPTELQFRSEASLYGGVNAGGDVLSIIKPSQFIAWEVIEYVD